MCLCVPVVVQVGQIVAGWLSIHYAPSFVPWSSITDAADYILTGISVQSTLER